MEKKKICTVDMTPTWAETLPTWKQIAETAYQQLEEIARGRTLPPNADPYGNLDRFWSEMKRMAETADKWNAYAKANIPVDVDCKHDWQPKNRGNGPGTIVTFRCKNCA